MTDADETIFLNECKRRATEATTPVPAIARALVDDLLERGEDDPLLQSMMCWLVERAPAMVAKEMRRWRPKAEPSVDMRGAKTAVSTFGAAVKANDLDALADFGLAYRVGGTEKVLADLTGADHAEVANGFQAIGEQSLMLATMHRQISRLLGSKRTADVLTPEQYRQLITKACPGLALPA